MRGRGTNREVNRAKVMKLRAKRYAERELINGRLVHPAPYGGHGSRSAYDNCGCRCDACSEANAEYCRERRARQRDS